MSGTVDEEPGGASPEEASPESAAASPRFVLGRRLGGGGMGEVFEAVQVSVGRRVAIKTLRAGVSDATSLGRFAREAMAAAAIRHPNIVQVFDVTHGDDGSPWIVQELLEGEDLRARLDTRGPMVFSEALALLGPVMDALHAAHQKGVVHRDVKPENIFLSRAEDGTVVPKLIDFGVARFALEGGEERGLTETGSLLGTPRYMSPEQCRGQRDLDPRADVWSMALVVLEACTGKSPFRADNRNALLIEIATEDLAPLDAIASTLPEHAREALAQALQRDRTARLSTIGDLHDALRAPRATTLVRSPRRSGARIAAGALCLLVAAAFAQNFLSHRSPVALVAPNPTTRPYEPPPSLPSPTVPPSPVLPPPVLPSQAPERTVTPRAVHPARPSRGPRVRSSPTPSGAIAAPAATPLAPPPAATLTASSLLAPFRSANKS